MRGVDRTKIVIYEGVIVPSSELIVKNNFPPKGFVLLGGGDY